MLLNCRKGTYHTGCKTLLNFCYSIANWAAYNLGNCQTNAVRRLSMSRYSFVSLGLRICASMSISALTLIAFLCLSGCGSGSSTGTSNPISVSVSTQSTTVDGSD